MTEHQEILQNLETKLVQSTNKLHEIYILASDFQESNKQLLRDRVGEFDSLLQSMYQYCKGIDKNVRAQLELPLKVIKDIDEGHKPDSYGKECIDQFKRNHKKDTIRQNGLKNLYDSICTQIVAEMDPELANNIINASKVSQN